MSAENRKLKVFLCHSKDDKPKVRELYHRLIADGFDPWLDEEKLMPGQEWDLEIQKAVRNSDTVVVCLSNSSTTKEGYIQKEIRFALDIADEKPEGTIFLIPARFEECNVPNRISRYQWVDLFEKSGFNKLKQSLDLRMNDLNLRYTSDEISIFASEDQISIPILGPITAGPFMLVPEPAEDYMNDKEYREVNIARSLLPKKVKGDVLYALEVIGNEMSDAMVNDGDIIILEPTIEARNGEMVVIRVEDEYTLKYFFEEKGHYRLQPANPTLNPIILNKNTPIEINGKVVMVIRKMQ